MGSKTSFTLLIILAVLAYAANFALLVYTDEVTTLRALVKVGKELGNRMRHRVGPPDRPRD